MVALLKSALMVEGTGSAHVGETVALKATGAEPSSEPSPDPEVAPTAKRRRFSGAEKRRILIEADRCTKPGEIGALLRREGIYASMLRPGASSAIKQSRPRWPRKSEGRSRMRSSPRLAS
jgi:transposase